MTARTGLLGVGLAFGGWETLDSFSVDVPLFAALFAVLFLAATAAYWRWGRAPAVVVLMALCLFEAAEAPFWAHASTFERAAAITLGMTGLVTGAAVLGRRHAPARSGGAL